MTSFEKYLSDSFDLVDILKSSENDFIAVAYDKNVKRLCMIKQRDLHSLKIYQMIREINSSHIPKIYRLFEREGKLIVIEEYIDGQTLEEFLNYRSIEINEKFAFNILKQICDCLSQLHEKDIIVRDIKPSNIMITKDNFVKLIDFGIARIFKPGNVNDTEFLGTRGYAAPEQFGLFDLGQTDQRTDIHNLGITIKNLLGEDYHGRLKKFLDRCTALDPNQRYQSVNELIRDIKHSRKIFLLKRLSLSIAMILILIAIPKTIDHGVIKEINSNLPIVEESMKNNEAEIEIEVPTKTSEFNDDAQKLIESTKSIEINNSTEIQIDPIVNEPSKKHFEDKFKFLLYINGKLSENRSPHSTAGDIILNAEEVYQKWNQNSEGDYLFPNNWTAQLKIENFTNKDLITPHITADFFDEEFIIDKPTIKSGHSINVEIPIANKIALKFLGKDHYYGKFNVQIKSPSYKILLVRYIEIDQ